MAEISTDVIPGFTNIDLDTGDVQTIMVRVSEKVPFDDIGRVFRLKCEILGDTLIDKFRFIYVIAELRFPVGTNALLIFDVQKRNDGFYYTYHPITFYNKVHSKDYLQFYFSGKLFKGIGKKTFEDTLWAGFQSKLLFLVKYHPDELPWLYQTLLEDLENSPDVRVQNDFLRHEFMMAIKALLPEGYKKVSLKALQKIFVEHYGTVDDMMFAFMKSPWAVFDRLYGGHKRAITFNLIDAIALEAGCPLDDPQRLEYGVGLAVCNVLANGSQSYLPSQLSRRKLEPWVGGNCYADLNACLPDGRPEFGLRYIPKIKEYLGVTTSEDLIWKVLLSGKSKFIDVVQLGNHWYVYDKQLLVAETLVAEIIRDMLVLFDKKPPVSNDLAIDEALNDFRSSCKGFKPNAEQEAGFVAAFKHRISVITGGPGAGKTALVSNLIQAINKLMPDKQPIVFAPTGKAVKQIEVEIRRNCGGKLSYRAATIAHMKVHSRLKVGFDTDFDGIGDVLYSVEDSTGRFHIVDEASMGGIGDFAAILQLARYGYVIIVGDVEQLPPIAQGQFFRDMFNLDMFKPGWLPLARLSGNYRVGSDLACLIEAFNLIREKPDVKLSDLTFKPGVFEANFGRIEYKTVARIVEDYVESVDKYGIENVICIAPVHAGLGGEENLNKILQDKINPIKKLPPIRQDGLDVYNKAGIEVFEIGAVSHENPDDNRSKTILTPLRIHDRVIITQNMKCEDAREEGEDVVVANGDCGYLEQYVVNSEDIDLNYVLVRLDGSGRLVKIDRGNFDCIALGYAMTVHKAQGSGYECVMVVYDNRMMYCKQFNSRNMFYTAITRTKSECHLYGDEQVFQQALDCILPQRNSFLAWRIASQAG